MSISRRTLGTAVAMLLLAGSAHAQAKKPLDHDAYDIWNRIQGQVLSHDGSWVAYRLVPGDGDAALRVVRAEGGAEATRPRGSNHRFSDDSRWIVYRISPRQEEVDQAKRDKKRPDEQPKDSLGVMRLDGTPSEIFAVENVKSFELPEEGSGWVAYLLERGESDDEPEPDEAEEPEEPEEAEEPEENEERDKDEGTPLILRNFASGEEHRFEDVTSYAFSKDGDRLYFTASNEDGTADGVYRVDTPSGAVTAILAGEGKYAEMALDESGERVAFLTNRDDWEAEEPAHALYVDGVAVVSDGADGLPSGWWINERGDVRFSEDGSRVFFGTQPRPEPEPEDDDMLPEDEVKLDVWNWRDPYIMPMQLVQAENERNRAFTAVVHLEDGAVVQLGTPDVPNVVLGERADSPMVLGNTDLPYRQLLSWDGRYADAYAIDVETGERRRVAEKVRGFGAARLSPTARYGYWWDQFERAWYVSDLVSGETRNVSMGIDVPLHDLFDDRPQPPNPAGSAVWTERDEGLLLYDWHDIWLVDPEGRRPPRNVTEGVGRRDNLRFRVAVLDPEQEGVPLDDNVVLTAFDLDNKQEGFYRDRFDRNREPVRLVMDDVNFGAPRKAEDADVVMLTRETFREFGDLHLTDSEFGDLRRISDANPQQSEYAWGTSELVEWTSSDGIELQGILYKPDDFDLSRKYPMMVYFYERSSQGLNGYVVPAAGSSSINRSFYVSRGYVLFVPDIPYEEGHPGESALDAVVPGVLSVVDMGFVDPEKIGVQGHSWGGYQIAHMVTRSNLFAAAEAGAPVVNMTSAYGGIRWQSGMVRQFQYEQTQSRIGGSLWERPLEYLDNSPLFQADKIQTPLLMLHNDEDGAVPWYQGIEMFAAMRRLGKPVWMLNYNGEAHGLRRPANRKDWAIRMQQFFDHYLMDAPIPVWMAEGVPATMKGKTLGLELITPKPITEQGGP